MPLWIVIMALGAAGTGWVFLKARQMEGKQTLKKVKDGSKSVKKAAKHMAAQPSGIEVYEAPKSDEEVNLSRDISGKVAKELEEILKNQR